ncbi:uncharacterized protein TNCV_1500171 [Trichonephila clavipes]|nr:uncharacterized protein TNCV_1500171 [Trichonephila clavipes]
MDPACQVGTVQRHGGSIMVWGVFFVALFRIFGECTSFPHCNLVRRVAGGQSPSVYAVLLPSRFVPHHDTGRRKAVRALCMSLKESILKVVADRPESSTRAVAHRVSVLPELLQDVLIAIRNCMWFQHDEVPVLFSINVRTYLNATFEARRIGRGRPVPWPPCEDLVARIFEAAACVREVTGIYENIRQSLSGRCQACIATGGNDVSCTLIGPPLLKSRPPLQAQVSKTMNIRVPDRGLKAIGAA